MDDFKEFSFNEFNEPNEYSDLKILDEKNNMGNNNSCFNLVDFGHIDNKPQMKEKKPVIEYDRDTLEKYRVLRKRKMDPVSQIELDENYSFAFKYKWDPYTGERLEEDQHGPLYFDPDILIKNFYVKRLDKLWVAPKDDQNGYFEGYYDDGVGAGEDFFVPARGHHPEWYIFRIPIIDCYLTKDHNKQYITFGPKLTDFEIKEIERIANLRPDNYKKLFGYNRPSLSLMKKLYDTAISKEPLLNSSIDKTKLSNEELLEYYNKANRDAVNSLIQMRG